MILTCCYRKHCNATLQDFFATTPFDILREAREYGWAILNENTWYCPDHWPWGYCDMSKNARHEFDDDKSCIWCGHVASIPKTARAE